MFAGAAPSFYCSVSITDGICTILPFLTFEKTLNSEARVTTRVVNKGSWACIHDCQLYIFKCLSCRYLRLSLSNTEFITFFLKTVFPFLFSVDECYYHSLSHPSLKPRFSLDFLLFLPESNWLSHSVDPKIDFFLLIISNSCLIHCLPSPPIHLIFHIVESHFSKNKMD